jgi:hypothetical protein
MFTGKADMPPLEAGSVADYGNTFNPESQERTLDRRRRHATRHASSTKTGGVTAHLESGRLGIIINSPMGQELIAELNSFEVDFTSSANMRVDVRSKDHHATS